jgi:multimeric flavodoxin WrbA
MDNHMKVLIINGSPKKNGNTKACASVLSNVLATHDIETEIFDLADYEFKPCLACGICFKTKDDSCIIKDDINILIEKCKEADGIILGSPIHYADISGLAKNAFDRLFYISGANGNYFKHKVGASYVCVRRSGGIAGYHTLNNYLMYTEMFIATSTYWNVIHGQKPNEILEDAEGIKTLETLADNIAYLLKVLATTSIETPQERPHKYTNFIR